MTIERLTRRADRRPQCGPRRARLADRTALQAFDIFEKLDLPDPKGEEWRYVDVRSSTSSGSPPRSCPTGIWSFRPRSQRRGSCSRISARALKDNSELVREHFFTEVPIDEHKFTALHGAFHSDDVLVYVPRGVEVEMPLEVGHGLTSGGSTFPHTTIVVDENASLTFVDRFESDDLTDAALCASVVEVEARRGATVNYISLQGWGRNTHHFQTQRFTGSSRLHRQESRSQPRLDVRADPGRVGAQG